MSRNPSSRMTGIVGCLNPSGVQWRALLDWSGLGGARPWCEDGSFRLLGVGAGPARAHHIDQAGLCGVLIGDIFELSQTGPVGEGRTTPVECLVRAYRRDGPDCLFGLDGQFSLFLWDRGRRELILFRDDSASRSVYFATLPQGGLTFADNLDLLVAGPLVEKRLARRSLHEYLRFLDISPPNSIYEGITAAEPGVLYRMGRELVRKPPPRPASTAIASLSLNDVADELEGLLGAAVAARMSPSGTTVAFLSGGVDSALLCQLAVGWGKAPVVAVTLGFEQSGFDESGVARQIANHLGVPHQVLGFPMDAYRDAFDELTTGIQYPAADPAGIPTFLAFRAAREIGAYALDGTGADTLMGVMPARHQRLAVQYCALLPPPLRRLAARGLGAIPGLRSYLPLVDFDDPEEILIRWRGWSRKEIEVLCREPVSLAHTRFYEVFRQFPPSAHLARYSALMGNLPDDRVHQAAALTGLEVRFPYFAPRVVTWVRDLELGLRYNPAASKRVLKAVLARWVPRGLWDQPKHGFDFPFLHLMTYDDCALVRRYLDTDVTESWNLFDRESIQAVKDAFVHGQWRSAFAAGSPAFKTWALIVLFAWLENHYRNL